MPRKLATLALAGFGVATVCAVIALSLGGPGRMNLGSHIKLDLPTGDFSLDGNSCQDDGAGAAISTRTVPWTDTSDKIEIDVAATVNSATTPGNNLIITGTKDAVDQIRIDGNRITGGCQPHNNGQLTITLPGRVFRRYDVDGFSKIDLTGLNQPNLDLHISGAALVNAAGVVQHTDLDVSGAASINLDDLVTQELHADLSGASNVTANPAQSADIDLSGAGLVTLHTRPKNYHADISGFGHIDVPDEPAQTE